MRKKILNSYKALEKLTCPEITINHKVQIDICIAEEIAELNNKHNILTLTSCCCHEKGCFGMVAIHPDCIEDLLKLGYVYNGIFQTTGRAGPTKGNIEMKYIFPTFITKSKCTGKCDPDKYIVMEEIKTTE